MLAFLRIFASNESGNQISGTLYKWVRKSNIWKFWFMKTWFKISILAKITKLLGILNVNFYFWICWSFFLSNNSIGAKDWELSGNKLGVSGNKLWVMSLQIKFHESTNQNWVFNCEPTIQWSENPVSLLKGLPCFIFAPDKEFRDQTGAPIPLGLQLAMDSGLV